MQDSKEWRELVWEINGIRKLAFGLGTNEIYQNQ